MCLLNSTVSRPSFNLPPKATLRRFNPSASAPRINLSRRLRQCLLSHTCKPCIFNHLRTLFGDGGLPSPLVSEDCALFPSQRRVGGYVTPQFHSAPKSFIIRGRQKPPDILGRTLLILLVTCIPAFIRPLLAQQPIKTLQPS